MLFQINESHFSWILKAHIFFSFLFKRRCCSRFREHPSLDSGEPPGEELLCWWWKDLCKHALN